MSDLAPGTSWRVAVAHRYLWAHERAYRVTTWVTGSALTILLVSALWMALSPLQRTPPLPTGAAAVPASDLNSLRARAGADPAALASLQAEADRGNSQAQFYLGTLYDPTVALQFSKDASRAVEWYRKSADQGFASAENNLGVLYARGIGATKNMTEAVSWFRKAADQGLPMAEDNLARAYATGQGVDRDDARAVELFRKAASQGLPAAQYGLGTMYGEGHGVTQDYTEAASWYEKAAVQGYSVGEYALGAAYAKGQGVPQDLAQARQWYRKAADHGYKPAQDALAGMGPDPK